MIQRINLNRNLLEFIIISIIIIISDETLFFGTNQNRYFVLIKYCILIVMLFYLSLKKIQTINLLKCPFKYIVCVGMCLLVFMTGILNGEMTGGYFYKCIILTLSCLIADKIILKNFAIKFEKIVYCFTIISVICTIIAEIDLSIFSIFPVFYNTADTAFYNLIFYMVPNNKLLLRNYSIFREPGVYQMFLITSLLFYIYYTKRVKIQHIIVYILAVVLTFSTTGYIGLAFTTLLYIVKKNNSLSERKTKYILLSLLMIGLIYMAVQTELLSLNGMIFNKFSNMQRNTTIARMSSIFTNISIWGMSPVFGVGLTKMEELFPILTLKFYGKYITHNTNTFLCELATYGILYTTIIAYGYTKFCGKLAKNKIEKYLLLTVFVVLSCGEKLTFSLVVYILCFYGLSAKNQYSDKKYHN